MRDRWRINRDGGVWSVSRFAGLTGEQVVPVAGDGTLAEVELLRDGSESQPVGDRVVELGSERVNAAEAGQRHGC